MAKCQNQNVATKCAKMFRFEPRFHGFVAQISRYESVKTRFKTRHSSSSYESKLILTIFALKKKHENLVSYFFVGGSRAKDPDSD